MPRKAKIAKIKVEGVEEEVAANRRTTRNRVPPTPLAPPTKIAKAGGATKRKAAPMKDEGGQPKKSKSTNESKGGGEAKKAKLTNNVKVKTEKIAIQVQLEGGDLLSVGQNDIGQLGLGDDNERERPTVVPMTEQVAQAIAGGLHTVCLTQSGKVFTFGCNDDGALGRNTKEEEEQFSPAQVQLPETIKQISAGDSHSAALTVTGRVYIWGSFRDGRGPMGLNTDHPNGTRFPIETMLGHVVVQIASGDNHFVALTNEGYVYTCGNCEHGQLGRVPRFRLDRGGRSGLRDCLTPRQIAFKHSPKFDTIWGTVYNTFARSTDNVVYGCGLNTYHQLGLPIEHDNDNIVCIPKKLTSLSEHTWTQIAAGTQHTIALNSNGQVFAMGRYEYGRLGLGVENRNDISVPTLIPTLSRVTCNSIGCGQLQSFATDTNGRCWSWGCGTSGQLGHGNEDDLFVPVVIQSAKLKLRNCSRVSSGAQHSLFIAKLTTQPNPDNANN